MNHTKTGLASFYQTYTALKILEKNLKDNYLELTNEEKKDKSRLNRLAFLYIRKNKLYIKYKGNVETISSEGELINEQVTYNIFCDLTILTPKQLNCIMFHKKECWRIYFSRGNNLWK